MDEFGILNSLKKMGYKELDLKIDTNDPFVHRLTVSDVLLQHSLKESSKFLISLWVRRKTYFESTFKKSLKESNDEEVHNLLKGVLFNKKNILESSVIEYLILQNPKIPFNHSTDVQLPSQNYPGLHVGKQFNELLTRAAHLKQRDCLMNIPEHFHNAYFYHSIGYRFASPAFEGYFHCLVKDLISDIEEKGIAPVSWAIYGGSLVHGDNKVHWKPEEQILPISDHTVSYIKNSKYKELVQHYQNHFSNLGKFRIDWDSNQGEYALSFKSDFKRPVKQLFGSPIVFTKNSKN
eukprot:TRINITY_DN17004_c0_g1_i1.p1 TRINITY_DN17004_c0_g1~~TRINITY_DN17004_c0_g1_i1.p1  ORF type:complete len:325 (-),score=70.06 TRINITY_DN17004_c0_g1_i1:72-947(-)